PTDPAPGPCPQGEEVAQGSVPLRQGGAALPLPRGPASAGGAAHHGATAKWNRINGDRASGVGARLPAVSTAAALHEQPEEGTGGQTGRGGRGAGATASAHGGARQSADIQTEEPDSRIGLCRHQGTPGPARVSLLRQKTSAGSGGAGHSGQQRPEDHAR